MLFSHNWRLLFDYINVCHALQRQGVTKLKPKTPAISVGLMTGSGYTHLIPTVTQRAQVRRFRQPVHLGHKPRLRQR